MTVLRSRAADPTVLVLAITLALLTVACSPAGGGAAQGPTGSVSPSATLTPSLTAVPGGSAAAASPAASIAQTDTNTAVGRIWDSLPPSFPRITGQVPAETGSGPTSGTFAVPGDTATAVAAVQAGLSGLDYHIDVGSPLEDGSVVLDAGGGDNPDCRIEVRFTPLSGTTTMAVLYGAACPFS
ncbi:MAG TPA: hypothetical protein VIM24_01930 [Candidatus Limnocylindrales bacterium]